MIETAVNSEVLVKARDGKRASHALAQASAATRTAALGAIARQLRANAAAIVDRNGEDLARARAAGISASLLDRLTLTSRRLEDVAQGVESVAAQQDVLGEAETWMRPNGLQIQKVRVPLGLVAIIYEARPNVTVEAASIAFKAGNAVLLRGSSSALATNRLLVEVMQRALRDVELPETLIQIIEDPDRDVVDQLVRLNQYVDVVIPRGGSELINRVVQTATVPVIETGIGNCHVYVDRQADLVRARDIVVNAKTHRPSVCNAAEKLLVHREVADAFLAPAIEALQAKGVEVRGCEETRKRVAGLKAADESDWPQEYLDLVIGVKVVDSIEQAIEHINTYGSHHSDAIVTEAYGAARQFTQAVDSAAVYVNASTRFTDGGEFGFGGEMGISTQKLHARGPMGVRELTTSKYVVLGNGQVRS